MINSVFDSNPPVILVVDDEKLMRFVLRQAIEKEGYSVAEASNGQQCLDICQAQPPDMVLLDAMMPEMDGFTCCSQLQTLLGDRCPPILMITALEDKKFREQAMEVGVTGYLTKPFDWDVLRQRVHRLLAHKWMEMELQIRSLTAIADQC
ncbi:MULTISPECIES: response regulator [Nostocales]|uniref:Response regulator n=3 Tax=Nostocales TaxID=1161 RepID=A0A0C1N3P8_9CYAN|nr:response regulator [Tolypothrix bouteillei]KAF3885045.1 response regulator [Tolypothrix bouteillei VB521301]